MKFSCPVQASIKVFGFLKEKPLYLVANKFMIFLKESLEEEESFSTVAKSQSKLENL